MKRKNLIRLRKIEKFGTIRAYARQKESKRRKQNAHEMDRLFKTYITI